MAAGLHGRPNFSPLAEYPLTCRSEVPRRAIPCSELAQRPHSRLRLRQRLAGVPAAERSLVPALASFNLGVEIGQIAGRSGFIGNGSPANAKPPRCAGADPPGVRGLRHLRGDHRPRQLLVPRSHPGYSLTPRSGAAPSAGSGSPEEFMPRLRQMAKKPDATRNRCR
jgi:hypothetical protein